MRLIDADALKRYVDRQKAQGDVYIGLIFEDAVKMIVDRQPTVDAVPVKRGKWILHKNGDATCDQCRFRQQHIWDFDNSQNFCGVCGADMRRWPEDGE